MADLQGTLGVVIETGGVEKAKASFLNLSKSVEALIEDFKNLEKASKGLTSASKESTSAASAARKEKEAEAKAAAKAAKEIQSAADKQAQAAAKAANAQNAQAASAGRVEGILKNLRGTLSLMSEGYDKLTASSAQSFSTIKNVTDAQVKEFIELQLRIRSVADEQQRAERDRAAAMRASQKAVQDQARAFESAEKAVRDLQNGFRSEIELLKQQRRALIETKDAKEAYIIASLRTKGATEEVIRAYLAEVRALRTLEDQLGQTEKQTSILGFSIQKTGQIIYNALAFAFGFGIYNTIQTIVTSFIDVAKSFDQVQVSLNTALGSATAATAEFDRLEKRATQLALPVYDTAKAFAEFKIASQGTRLSTDQLRESFDGFLVASAGANLALEQFQGVMRAVGQIMSKGKVQAEELRGQLGDRLPGAFALTAKALGLSMAELDKNLKLGLVSAEEFALKIGAVLKETFGPASERRLQTVTGSIQNLKNAFISFYTEANRNGASSAVASSLNAVADAVRYVNENFQVIVGTVKSVGAGLAVAAGFFAVMRLRTVETRAALLAAITATKGFQVAIAGLLALFRVTPLGLLFTAAAVALGKFAVESTKASERMRLSENAAKDLKDAFADLSITGAAAEEALSKLAGRNLAFVNTQDLDKARTALENNNLTLEAANKITQDNLDKTKERIRLGGQSYEQWLADSKAVQQFTRVLEENNTKFQQNIGLIRAINNAGDVKSSRGDLDLLREEAEAVRKGQAAYQDLLLSRKALKEIGLDDNTDFSQLTGPELAKFKEAKGYIEEVTRATDGWSSSTKVGTAAQKEQKDALEKQREAISQLIVGLVQQTDQVLVLNSARKVGLADELALIDAQARQYPDLVAALEIQKQMRIEANFERDTIEAIAEIRQEILDIQKEGDSLQKEIDLYPKVIEYLNKGLDLQKATLAANLDREEAEARLLKLQAEQLPVAEKQVALAKADAALAVVRLKRQKAVNDESIEGIEKQKQAFADFISQIEEDLGKNIAEGIYKGFEDGKSLVKNFKDTLKNAFKSFVLQVLIQPVVQGGVQGVTGILQGLFGGAQGTQGAQGGAGLLSQLFGLLPTGSNGINNPTSPGFVGPTQPTQGGLSGFLSQLGGQLFGGSNGSTGGFLNQLSNLFGGTSSTGGGGLLGRLFGGANNPNTPGFVGPVQPGTQTGGLGSILGSAGIGFAAGQFGGSLLQGQGVFGENTANITGATTAIGTALGGPIGAALGFAAGTLISGFMGRWVTESKRLTVTFTDDIADAETITKRRKKRIGNDKKKTIVDEQTELDAIINEVFSNAYKSISKSASVFGRAIGDDFNLTITRSIKKVKADQIAGVVQEITDEAIAALVRSVAPFVEEFQKAGENLAQTFARVAANFSLVSESLEFAGANFADFFKKAVSDFATQRIVQGPEIPGGSILSQVLDQLVEDLNSDNPFSGLDWASLIGASDLIEPLLALREQGGNVAFFQDILDAYDAFVIGLTESIVEFAGGSEAFAKSLSDYTSAFFSEPERVQQLQEGINELLAPFDLELPDTAQGFRALVESLLDVDSAINITSEAGREAYATLLGLSAEAARVYALLDPEGLRELQDPRAIIEERSQILEGVVDNFLSTIENLKDFRTALRQQGQTPDISYQELRENFLGLAGRAAQGDASAIDQIQQSAQAFFQASEEFFGAGTAQTEADRALILEQIGVTIESAKSQVEVLLDQLAVLNDQSTSLTDIEAILAAIASQAGVQVTPSAQESNIAEPTAGTALTPEAPTPEPLATTAQAPAVSQAEISRGFSTLRLEELAALEVQQLQLSNSNLQALLTLQQAANQRLLAHLSVIESKVTAIESRDALSASAPTSTRPTFAR